MPDPVETYLATVMLHAGLAPVDARRVRAELREHLYALAASGARAANPSEIPAMLNEQFGDPAADRQLHPPPQRGAPGDVHQKTHRGKLAAAAAIAMVCVLSVRWAVAEVFYIPNECASPVIPKGSHCLVYKLCSGYHPGDMVIFRSPDGVHNWLATVRAVEGPGGMLTLSRNGADDLPVSQSDVIGRVVLNTR